MTPDEAALSLRDDPTFAALSRSEQEEEACALLGTDDPLDIALAIEAALAEPVALSSAAGVGAIEECRNASDDNPVGCGGREPVAANGRCMTCGATRAAAETLAAPQTAVEPVSAPPAPQTPAKAVTAPVARPAKRHRHKSTPDEDTGGGIVARFKEATGMSDQAVGEVLGMSRTTAQAYAAGRLTERLNTSQLDRIRAETAIRLELLAELDRMTAVAAGSL